MDIPALAVVSLKIFMLIFFFFVTGNVLLLLKACSKQYREISYSLYYHLVYYALLLRNSQNEKAKIWQERRYKGIKENLP